MRFVVEKAETESLIIVLMSLCLPMLIYRQNCIKNETIER